MAIRDQKELFVRMLSDVRQGAEQSAKIYQEMSQQADRPEVKEALEARAFVSNKVLSTLDECFKIIGQQPTQTSGRMRDVFVEDFRKELGEIQSPEAKLLFILAKAHHLNQMRVGEYVVLIEAADMTGHFGIGLLLSTCLADKLAFVERTRKLIRNVVEGKWAMSGVA